MHFNSGKSVFQNLQNKLFCSQCFSGCRNGIEHTLGICKMLADGDDNESGEVALAHEGVKGKGV